MLDPYTGALIAALKVKLAEMKPDDRLEVIAFLQEGFCPHCGCDRDGMVCHCANDE